MKDQRLEPRGGGLRFDIHTHRYGSKDWPVLVCRLPLATRTISSSPLGGGLGRRHWVVNAQVPASYARRDPRVHLGELASGLGLRGGGVGMLTAADVRRAVRASQGGVTVLATVGTDCVEPAAVPPGRRDSKPEPSRTGRTINIVVLVPKQMSDSALVNAVATATEAKAQALGDAGFSGTGTATDALCICCPTHGEVADYGGPRSRWGSRIASAVHSAVLEGAGTRADTPWRAHTHLAGPTHRGEQASSIGALSAPRVSSSRRVRDPRVPPSQRSAR